MAEVKLKSEATKKTSVASSDWDCLNIRKAGNGFIIQKSFNYDPSLKKQKADPEPYLAMTPEDADVYIDKCLGVKEKPGAQV